MFSPLCATSRHKNYLELFCYAVDIVTLQEINARKLMKLTTARNTDVGGCYIGISHYLCGVATVSCSPTNNLVVMLCSNSADEVQDLRSRIVERQNS